MVRQRFFRRGSARRRDELEIVVDQVLVDVVAEQPDLLVAQQHVGQAAQLLGGVGRAGRVVRRVQDQPLGARRDRRFEVVRLQLEAGLLRAAHDHRRAAGEQGHVGIGNPVRCRDDHLVARIEGRHQGVVDDLLAAGADADLIGAIGQPVLARELADDRRLEFRRTVDRGVFGLPCLDRADRRGLDVVRRVEVRLAGAQPDHVASGRLELAREIADLQSWARV